MFIYNFVEQSIVIHRIINSLSTYPQQKEFCLKSIHRIGNFFIKMP